MKKDLMMMNGSLKLIKKRRNLHTVKQNFYDTSESKIQEVEVFVPYKQLETDGSRFLNSKPNGIPKSYMVKLLSNNQTILNDVQHKKQKIHKAYYRDMNGIFYHDGIDEEYFMSNAGYVKIINTPLERFVPQLI